jgi:hypothetical protein
MTILGRLLKWTWLFELSLVQFWNQKQNHISFLELDTTRTTSRGVGYGTKLEPPPFGYGIASNQNWTWGELELYQDFFSNFDSNFKV